MNLGANVNSIREKHRRFLLLMTKHYSSHQRATWVLGKGDIYMTRRSQILGKLGEPLNMGPGELKKEEGIYSPCPGR
jgi:hypothetical protein